MGDINLSAHEERRSVGPASCVTGASAHATDPEGDICGQFATLGLHDPSGRHANVAA